MKYHVLEKQRKIGIAKTATTRHSKNFSMLTSRAEWVTYYQGQNNSSERGDTVVLLWSGNAPRTYSSIEKIRAELTWATVMPDPNKCGCRNLRCCEETGHKPVHVTVLSQRSFGRSPGKYYCQPCRENGHLVRFFQIKVVKNRRIWRFQSVPYISLITCMCSSFNNRGSARSDKGDLDGARTCESPVRRYRITR